jgi:hypothetical protein
MPLKPYYEPDAVTPCYKLRYGWAGWPTRGARFPNEMEQHLSAPAEEMTNLHVKRWKEHRREVGYGHLYQGRFACFPTEQPGELQSRL